MIWSAIVLFDPEVVDCRQNDIENSAGYWFFVAFCCVVGAMYSLILVGVCCLLTCCLCFIVIILFQQHRNIRLREAVNRVPLAQAAMQRIGQH